MNTQNQDQGTPGEGTALQQQWLELLSNAMQATFGYGAGSPQSEPLRQVRTSSFQGWTQSWDELLRSSPLPQALKQWMGNTDPFGTRADAANEDEKSGSPGRSSAEMESAILLVCQMEKSLLGKLKQLSDETAEVKRRLERLEHKDRGVKSTIKKARPRIAREQHRRSAWKTGAA